MGGFIDGSVYFFFSFHTNVHPSRAALSAKKRMENHERFPASGAAPSAAQRGAPPATPDAVMGTQQIVPGLGPLPATPNGMSVAEQILHSSWKSLMARNVGRSVIVSFLIGTQNTIVTHGILYEVGNDYIALYQPDEQSYISADLYSIRFMEFLPEISQTNSQQQQQP